MSYIFLSLEINFKKKRKTVIYTLSPSVTSQITFPLEGLIVGNVFPLTESHHSLLMKSWKVERKLNKEWKIKYYILIWVYDIWYDIGKLTICVVSLAEWNINKRKIQRGKNLVYVSIFFIRLWSVGTAVIFDTQNPEISGFCACVQIQN